MLSILFVPPTPTTPTAVRRRSCIPSYLDLAQFAVPVHVVIGQVSPFHSAGCP